MQKLYINALNHIMYGNEITLKLYIIALKCIMPGHKFMPKL